MKKLTVKAFKNSKSSDTIFILGSGNSINQVTPEQWSIIGKHDSIGFNWFCKHSFEPSFFLIREQANLPFRCSKGESVKTLIKRVNRYKNTGLVICDVSSHCKKCHKYHKEERLRGSALIVNDCKSRKWYRNLKYMDRDPVANLIHGTCTMYNVLHLVRFLRYETIVFVGVDLNNSKYFWLRPEETRHTLVKKRLKVKGTHPIAKQTIRLVNKFCGKFGVNAYKTNRKSLLHCPLRSIQSFG